MRKLLQRVPLLLALFGILAALDANIHEFFDRFTANWVKADPEQDRLDGLLSDASAKARLNPTERTSARVLDWQLDSIVRGAQFEDTACIFNEKTRRRRTCAPPVFRAKASLHASKAGLSPSRTSPSNPAGMATTLPVSSALSISSSCFEQAPLEVMEAVVNDWHRGQG